MVFISSPCVSFQKDKLHEHQKTQADAIIAESYTVAAKCSGGIRATMNNQICLKRRAVTGSMKCLYSGTSE